MTGEKVEDTTLKVFIRDIPKFTQDETSQYHFHFCGLKFKAVQVHGVLTELYTQEPEMIMFQLNDPTGSVDVYFNPSNYLLLQRNTMVKLSEKLEAMKKWNNSPEFQSYLTMTWMRNEIKNITNDTNFKEGDCVSVIGDIFTDKVTNTRKISACVCSKTSLTMDIVWLQNLLDLYRDKYFCKKSSENGDEQDDEDPN